VDLAAGCIHSHPNQAILNHTKAPNIEVFNTGLRKTAEMQSEMARKQKEDSFKEQNKGEG
jgi:hypothetical protein